MAASWNVSVDTSDDFGENREENSEESESKRQSFAPYLGDDTVCIYVGQEKRKYRVHHGILRDQCPFFKAKFDFAEKADSEPPQSIDLGDVTTPEVFDNLIEFLYTGTYIFSNMSLYTMSLKDCEAIYRLYQLADYLMIDSLKARSLQDLGCVLQHLSKSQSQQPLKTPDVLQFINLTFPSTYARQVTKESKTNIAMVHAEAHENAATQETLCADLEEKDKEEPIAQPMSSQTSIQDVIAHFVVRNITMLRKDDTFMQLILEGGELLTHVIMCLPNITDDDHRWCDCCRNWDVA